jgi:hypothetical protein
MLSFIALALPPGEVSPLLRRIVIADVVASVALLAAMVLALRGSG